MSERRKVYFAFQGLLMAVLLMLFAYHRPMDAANAPRLLLLACLFAGSLLFLRIAPDETLRRWWVQTGFFIGDAFLASLTLHWTQSRRDVFLIYFLIIFGTALTRNFLQTLTVALISSGLYFLVSWDPIHGFPEEAGFWLQANFLWIATSLLAILARDSSQLQTEREGLYQQRLRQLESLATLGQLAGEIAHRIKAPLTTIRVNAEVLSMRLKRSSGALKELRQIQNEVAHCKAILKNLLSLGRIEDAELELIDLRAPLRNALKTLEPQMRAKGIKRRLAPMGEPLMVRGDPSLLFEACSALIQNAVEACARGGTVSVEARTESKRLRAWPLSAPVPLHVLSIADDGVGISPENLKSLFEPFFTTKTGEGSGLGLSAALRIAHKHGGDIEAQSAGPGRGALFTLKIPAVS